MLGNCKNSVVELQCETEDLTQSFEALLLGNSRTKQDNVKALSREVFSFSNDQPMQFLLSKKHCQLFFVARASLMDWTVGATLW